MKHQQTKSRKNLIALAACLLLALAGASMTRAQQASNTYRGAQHDPFEKRKFNTKPVKAGPKLIEAPPVESRIKQYKERKAAAVAAQLPAPKPTTAFLLNEIHVTGIFRTPRGWAAMVEADPIDLSYTVYPGETFYNGMLVAIEETRLVFRREARWTDGKRETIVEMKPLAAPNAVKDSMTTVASDASATHSSTPSLPNGNTALNDEVMKKMVEGFTKMLLPMFNAPAGIDPNSPELKNVAERLKGTAKPKS
jgi:hypothetical protein